jgi:hypothetical protein
MKNKTIKTFCFNFSTCVTFQTKQYMILNDSESSISTTNIQPFTCSTCLLVQQKNFNDKECVVFMRKIFNRQLIGAHKHMMWCEGNAVQLLLPEGGVNKHLNA